MSYNYNDTTSPSNSEERTAKKTPCSTTNTSFMETSIPFIDLTEHSDAVEFYLGPVNNKAIQGINFQYKFNGGIGSNNR